MVRRKKKIGARQYKTYNEETLQRAVLLVKSHKLTERQAAEEFGISKSTIHRKIYYQLEDSRLDSKTIYQDWIRAFLSRHKNNLTVRLSENVKRARVATIRVGKKVIVRRGVKHAECIKDTSKSSTSVMFSGTASGVVLPIYVVYKADHLYDAWTLDGPKRTRYNRSKSGWSDTTIFEDWFLSAVIPYFRRFKNQNKVMIGSYLASHISKRVIEKCQSNNISFVLLPHNCTHLCQPLDLAFFRPLKWKWKQQLDLWKDKNKGVLQKNQFPRLLNKVMKELGDNAENNLKAGFEECGIVPFDPQKVLKRIPQRTISTDNSCSPDDQLPSSSGTQAINSDEEDNIEDITLSLKVTDFIQ
ncbi:uncharacterized protein LOC115034777, partial [Acyrthosiphon pisum]|uniref:DDE-1 domain-containing protein n=1 Tax=Acyrthosiphon pisum TaxID=7029 RepID=A0A8R2JV18_ACYPI